MNDVIFRIMWGMIIHDIKAFKLNSGPNREQVKEKPVWEKNMGDRVFEAVLIFTINLDLVSVLI